MLRPRIAVALLPLLLLLLARPGGGQPCPSYLDTGYAVFGEANYLSACDFTHDLDIGDFTVELWVKIPELFVPVQQITFFSYNTATVNDALLVWNIGYDGTKNQFMLQLFDQSSPAETQDNDRWDLTDGLWHHIAVSRRRDPECDDDRRRTPGDGEQCCWVSFYKDGEFIETVKMKPCKTIPSGGCVMLGQEQDQMCNQVQQHAEFQGFMTEVRLWRSVRTEAEIKQNMYPRIGLDEAKSTASLVALWPLDCVFLFQELVAGQNLGSCVAPLGGPPKQTAGGGSLSLATIDETCPAITDCCGNGNLDPGEECDDGNTADGDGCSAACESECGNGVLDGVEE